MKEFDPINFPGYYVDDKSNIWSTHGRGGTATHAKPFLRKPSITKNGYLKVVLFDRENKRRNVLVHRAVCLAYHGAPPHHAKHVRHLNGNRLDNRPSNLAWGSVKDNAADTKRHGTGRGQFKSGDAHPRSVRLRICKRIVADRARGMTHKALAVKYGIHHNTVTQVLRRHT